MIDHPAVRWLLDVDRLPPDASGLRLVWEHPWPGWMWAILVLAAGALATLVYLRQVGSTRGRATLAAVRAFLLLLLLVLVSGPMLELPREQVEEDWVLFLVDRSESMTVADAGEAGDRVSRNEQLRELLAESDEALAEIDSSRRLLWLGFHGGVFELPPADVAPEGPTEADEAPDAPLPALPPAEGERTDLDAALEQALRKAAARPIAGVVLLTDGRTTSPPSVGLVRRLQAEAIQVFPVPLGSDRPLGDLAVGAVEAPRRAFLRDRVPVTVELARAGRAFPADAAVELVDETTGEVLDRIPLEAALAQAGEEGPVEVTLTAEPQLAGRATWRVRVDAGGEDLIPENNARAFEIELIDRPLRVLYVEGYPRWEYRYLKSLLIREPSIESSIMLVSADRDFAQEGNMPLARLPREAEEIEPFDLIVLGDVPAGFFTPRQLEIFREHVAERGAGLLWIAGERAVPDSYRGTTLADLLPVRGSLSVPPIGTPVTVRPTELARRLGVLRLGSEGAASEAWPEALEDPETGWSRLFYAQHLDPSQVKPTAEVLAQTAQSFGGQPIPIVLSMRYGAGQTLYVGTDEIWRWRYGRGELLPERFWLQLIRLLARSSLAGERGSAVLLAEPRRVEIGDPVRVELRLLDQRMAEAAPGAVTADLLDDAGRRVGEITLSAVEDAAGEFAATILPEDAGRIRVRLDAVPGAPEGVGPLTAEVDVVSPDDELRRPETDHPLLARLAAETGGEVIAPAEFARLNERLPDRAVRIENPLAEAIWDTPLAFILVLLALTGEWVGRKLLRLA